MTNSDRLNRMEDQLIDMRLAVSALLETVTQHQRNFEIMQRNFEVVVTEMRDMKAEIRGLQTENRRILDILQHRSDEQDPSNDN